MSMERVAERLNAHWAAEVARVHYLTKYYSEDRWSYDYLKTLGITQIDLTPPPGEAEDRPPTSETAFMTTSITKHR